MQGLSHYRLCCRFFARPKKTITKSQYAAAAKAIALRAQDLAREAKELRNEENAGGRNRKWRGRAKDLGKKLSLLEDDERELEKQYPQVRGRASSVSCPARVGLLWGACRQAVADVTRHALVLPMECGSYASAYIHSLQACWPTVQAERATVLLTGSKLLAHLQSEHVHA